jgi:hypothetical protein
MHMDEFEVVLAIDVRKGVLRGIGRAWCPEELHSHWQHLQQWHLQASSIWGRLQVTSSVPC